MTSFEQLSSTQKIRAALHRDVRAISKETCHFLGLEISKPAMEIIAELVYKKLSIYGVDLEAFAKHGKRSTINTEDVKLLVRRCPSLKTHLNAIAPTVSVTKEKKRKTITAAVRQPETPTPKAKEAEIQTSNQKESELQISKQIDSGAHTATAKQDVQKEDESMDDLIDLTFD
ncbi:unnamed protein product [Arctia plantaginis]|uniref:Centromere protein S n=1 Tax=Arctia plantaginis TaxID=874455 RepID=A0A8S1BQ64_ARCPL|nr:unnamed protein product [Arctia plantaginis]